MSTTQINKPGSIDFIAVWPGQAKSWAADIRHLWEAHPEARAIGWVDNRINSAVVLVVADGRAVGLSTAWLRQVRLLNNGWFYEFRMFIAPEVRQPGLDAKVIQQSVAILEQAAKTDPHQPIGLLAQIQNEQWCHSPTAAPVLRVAPLYLVGYTSKGYPIRVLYFKNARISPN